MRVISSNNCDSLVSYRSMITQQPFFPLVVLSCPGLTLKKSRPLSKIESGGSTDSPSKSDGKKGQDVV